jgi:hypothetical protein
VTPRWLALLEPPLVPSPDEARSRLRRELLRPEYHEQDLLQRLLVWLGRQIDRGLAAAAQTPPLSALVAMALGLALVLALVWLTSRVRSSGSAAAGDGEVLTRHGLPAATLRERAEAALAEQRPADALLDAFRAVAVRAVERGALEDRPGATAHEVAVSLAGQVPEQADRVTEAARLFDEVLYGDRPATAGQALAVLRLDDDLAGVRR